MTVKQEYKTRVLQVGNVAVGGDSPISVQSMCNTDTRDIPATLRQIADLVAAGADVVPIVLVAALSLPQDLHRRLFQSCT